MSNDNGGSAFPEVITEYKCNDQFQDIHSVGGMTLRDYFAAKAMVVKFGKECTSIDLERMAECCYQLADAMLRARSK
jgi:hypothetical protein